MQGKRNDLTKIRVREINSSSSEMMGIKVKEKVIEEIKVDSKRVYIGTQISLNIYYIKRKKARRVLKNIYV